MDSESCVKCSLCCKELNLLEVHFSSETLLAFARRLLKEEVSSSPTPSLEGYNTMLFQLQNGVSNFCLCGRCNDSLKNAYFFKETCISTDNILRDHLDTNCETVDLKQLICTLVDVKDSADLAVCRLCRSFSNTSAVVPLDDIVKESSIMEVFQKHIPEVNLTATQHPIVCQCCQESLINFTNLLFLFLTGHGKILDHHGKWLEIKEEMTDFDDIQIDENHFQAHENHIKQEPIDETVERSPIIDEDDDDDKPQPIEDKNVERKTTANLILSNLYHECRICGYRTRITDLFKEHMSKHHTDRYKYNCSRCPFETNSYASSLSHVRFHSRQWPGRKKSQKQAKFKSKTLAKIPLEIRTVKMNGATKVDRKVIEEEVNCALEAIHYCELCDFKTLSLDDLKAHVEVHMKR